MNKWIVRFLAIGGLVLTLLPSVLAFNGAISTYANKSLMAMGMLLWFVCAPLWMRRK